jgi:hypothetical protein
MDEQFFETLTPQQQAEELRRLQQEDEARQDQ